MEQKGTVIHFPGASSFPEEYHSLPQGGTAMKVKHTHPEYANEAERLERLRALKQTCLAELAAVRKADKRTA